VTIGEAQPLKKPNAPSFLYVFLMTYKVEPPLIYCLTFTRLKKIKIKISDDAYSNG